ncbi:hypothetical protein C1H46_021011 [Malus baccata]|uniref:Uncharacterized protein n=1 Tax=Malus baccata TaxID=106549 RepID=A0A540M4B1_MALBA|nr:hypothetical protein C1H46_021011 [Malus baccata]
MSSSPGEKPSPATDSLSERHESVLRLEEDEGEDEDEEEDVDFNPFLKGILSPEASSSLSSDVEGLDGGVVDSSRTTIEPARINSLRVACEVQKCSVGDSEHGEEETLMQTNVSPDGTSENEFEKTVSGNANSEAVQEEDHVSSSETDVNVAIVGELTNTEDIPKPTMDLDDEDEDAICKRTRARYSLASFTLDELENFLQETDDEDDLQNVDDEEEYRKFLTAVLQGEGDDQSTKENENADDEDEDNDADFEIELEELLESDGDENSRDNKSKDENGGAGRRPKTRQNKCQKAPAQCKKKNLGQTKRPLRPLLPVMPKGPMSCFSNHASRNLMLGTASSCLSSTAEERSINGFTALQIGQLHCLIHEHVQLLIQVFSLCALDYSRQHIASQVQKLISEMLQKRDEVLTWKNVPYPTVCFFQSVPTEFPNSYRTQSTLASSLTFDARNECSSTNQMAVSSNTSPANGRCECVPNGQVGISQNVGGSFWVPSISGPVLSVLDVAPLSLVGRYMDEVNTAVQKNRRCYVETSSDTRLEKEPLFPFPNFPLGSQATCEFVSETGSSSSNVASSSSSQRPPKKSLAATIVESTKKQSLALVPKDISNLAQRFFPLFNPALFPYKPPTGAVANQILFTDTEDE